MNASFDIAANKYDDSFTNTAIGRLQRDRVWTYLKEKLPKNKSLKILELNCGTGEDAIFLAKLGHEVTATDISEQMVEMTRAKVKKPTLKKRIHIQKLDINNLGNTVFPHQFDVIFSNFGGLNCLNKIKLKKLSEVLHKHLAPEGRFISVVMPSYCLIESLYFLAKREWKKIFRRKSKKALAVNVDGVDVKTWYFSPKEFEVIFSPHLKKVKVEAIGFLPSYLEILVQKKPKLINIDKMLYKFTPLTGMADHFLIDLKIK